MGIIYNIKYIDAYYSTAETFDGVKIFLHEAYGFVDKNGNNIVITFIKKKGSSFKEVREKNEDIQMGLVIPDTSLVSVAHGYPQDILEDVSLGSSVSVVWRDIVYVAHMPRYDCAIMYTEGVLVKIEGNCIVLKNPETIRTHPLPIKNHPVEKSTYYTIPISFISKISVIESKK